MYRRSRKSPLAARACWGAHTAHTEPSCKLRMSTLVQKLHWSWWPITKAQCMDTTDKKNSHFGWISYIYKCSLTFVVFLSLSFPLPIFVLIPNYPHLLFIFLPPHLVISTGRTEAEGDSSPLTFSPLEPQIYLHCGGGKWLWEHKTEVSEKGIDSSHRQNILITKSDKNPGIRLKGQ